jgi:hypothetical protein
MDSPGSLTYSLTASGNVEPNQMADSSAEVMRIYREIQPVSEKKSWWRGRRSKNLGASQRET